MIVLLICVIFSKYSGEFLEYEVGARATGIGGAFTACCNDPTAYYWNPAIITNLKNSQVMVEYCIPFSNFYKIYSIALNYQNTSAFGFTYFLFDSILHTDTLGNILSIFNVKDYIFNISTGKEIKNFSAGLNIKFIFRDYFEAQCYGIGVDFGLFKILHNIRIGTCIKNIFGTHLLWNNGTYEIVAPSASIGISSQHVLKSGKLIFAIDFTFYSEEKHTEFEIINMDTKMGVEYIHQNLISFRLGKDASMITLGAGLNLPGLYLDGAVKIGHSLGTWRKISGGVIWR